LWPVQPNDYVEVNGGGQVHRIQSIANTSGRSVTGILNQAPLEADTLILASALPQPVNFTRQYRIVRRPRVLPGEEGLQMAQDVAIDKTRSIVPAPPDGSIDIVFAPSGAVSIPGASDKIILWVRDVTQDSNTPVLIVIYVR